MILIMIYVIDIDDCIGEYDDCGICNGDGIPSGNCDCNGNVEDCLGMWW